MLLSRNFKSDNVAPVCDAILAAINAANRGSVPSYAAMISPTRCNPERARCSAGRSPFSPVTTGTAANSLALSQFVPPYGAVYCHELAHIVTDECAAPEFFTGGAKLIGFPSADGKINPQQVAGAAALARGDGRASRQARGGQPDAVDGVGDCVRSRRGFCHRGGGQAAGTRHAHGWRAVCQCARALGLLTRGRHVEERHRRVVARRHQERRPVRRSGGVLRPGAGRRFRTAAASAPDTCGPSCAS